MRAVIAGFIVGLVAACVGGIFFRYFWHPHHPAGHASVVAPVVASPEPICLPRCDGLIPDGNAATWGAQGFRLNVLQDMEENSGPVPPARVFLAWNAGAFLVRVEADVPATSESETDDLLWSGDSVVLYLSAGPGLAVRSFRINGTIYGSCGNTLISAQ